MKKEIIMKNVSSVLSRTKIGLRKYGPDILVVAGIAGTIASTVLACRATTKLSTILDESKENVETIHKCADDENMKDKYSKDDAKKDLAIVYVHTGVKLAKLYAPSIALGVVSITGIVVSHDIMRKRNKAIAAAYATLGAAFKEYRGRVVERFGEEIDKELRYNIKAKKFEETTVDPESGKEKKVKSTANVAEPSLDDYTLYFDGACKNSEESMDYNLMFLRSQQQLANDKLKADGYLFLSDIYDALGIKKTKMSQTVGWIYKPDGNKNGDNFVDFGTVVTNRATDDGYEEVILMNFNVDGPILDLI